MLPDTFWKIELAGTLGKKRGLILKSALPLLLIVPLALPTIPLPVKAGGFVLAIAFVGIFGSAIGLSRLKEQRLTDRLALLPIPPWRLVTGYLLLNAGLDGIQFTIPLLVFLFLNPTGPGVVLLTVSCFGAVLIAANCVGVLAAVASRSSGEGHLVAILATLFVAGVSGLFSGSPASGQFSWGMVLPFRHFADVLQLGADPLTINALTLLIPLSLCILVVSVVATSSRLIRRY